VSKFIFPLRVYSFIRSACLLVTTLLLTVGSSYSQSHNQTSSTDQAVIATIAPRQILPETLPGNWRAIGATRNLNANANADVYTEYGLLSHDSRNYTDGKNKVTVEIFETRFVLGAYGLFTFSRGSDPASNQQQFYQGRYFVRISNETGDTSASNSLVEAIKAVIPTDAGELPVLPSHLPEQNKIAGTEKYFVGPTALATLPNFSDLKSVVDFTGGAEAVTANYQNGNGTMSIVIVEYHTPQLATDGYARFEQYFNSLNQTEKDRRLLRRIGNYVVEAVGIQDKAAAEDVVGQIKYTPKVYWEGRRMRDIPLESRPPDPAAIAEANQTAKVIIRALYWIGVLLLGIIALGIITGSAFFYWRRYRRRKLGLDDLFSDAGGSLSLNLSDYLLPDREASVKQIGKGEQ
jgi:hypothetical protein